MILLGNLMIAIGTVLDSVIVFFMLAFLLLFIFSWVNADRNNIFVQFVYSITDPLLVRLRRRIPPWGVFDTAFLVAILGMIFIKAFLVQSILEYGYVLKSMGIRGD